MAVNTDKVLVSHEEIEQMLDRLSKELNRDYKDDLKTYEATAGASQPSAFNFFRYALILRSLLN